MIGYCTVLQESFVIQDLLGYRASGSKTFSSSSFSKENIFDLGSFKECEITCNLSPSNNGKGIALHYLNNPDPSSYDASNAHIRIGTNGDGLLYASQSNGSTMTSTNANTHWDIDNNPYQMKLKVQNGVIEITVGSWTSTLNTSANNLRYIGLGNWNNAKTISYTDLKVKPL